MWFILPAAYLLGALTLHAIVGRVFPSGNRVRQFLAVGGAMGIGLGIHVALYPNLGLAAQVANILAYAFACELYIFLFTFVTSSVSAALLISKTADYDRAPIGSPPLTPAGMVQRRLEAMHAAGLLQKSGLSFSPSPRAIQLVRLYRYLRRFFHHSSAT